MQKQRNSLMNTLRGIALFAMLTYHLLYDVEMVYGTLPWMHSTAVHVWQQSILCTFLLLAGFALPYDNHPYKTAGKLMLCGGLITAVTVCALPQAPVWFGVLHCIATCMALTALFTPFLKKVPPVPALLICLFVMLLLRDAAIGGVLHWFGRQIALPKSTHVWALLFGVPTTAAVSSIDFVPLVPWLFAFWAGWFLHHICKPKQWGTRLTGFRLPVLTAAGRYSLPVYLISQPVCYGCILLLHRFI